MVVVVDTLVVVLCKSCRVVNNVVALVDPYAGNNHRHNQPLAMERK